jgi:hypothetical protein
MAEINWTVITYLVVGLFALSGFFKGWWKEAITAGFLVFLVFLLQQPEVATAVVDFINTIIMAIWNILPPGIKDFLYSMMANVFGVTTASADTPPLFDPGSATTWIIFLIVLMILAVIVGRLGLRRDLNGQGSYYAPTFVGSILGGLLGALNGFIIINLIKAYLVGINLPTSTAANQYVVPTGGTVGVASVGFQATAVPQYSILDSFIPWIVIVGGMLVFITALGTRFNRQGLNVSPKKASKREVVFGYKPYDVILKPPVK